MVETCSHIGMVEHKFETMAAAFAALKVAPVPEGQTCSGCGKPGHFKKDRYASKGAKQTKKNPPRVCLRCRKGQHYAKQCCFKYDTDDEPISGNLNWSM